jgi:SAM-dependent methyltransferase
MDSFADRIKRSVAQRGLLGTGQMCWGSLVAWFTPSSRDAESQRQQIDVLFDQENGVDTGGIVRPKPQSVMGHNWAYGIRYQAIDPTSFVEAMREIAIPYADFTFIDFGSGKGRALLLASQFPFKKIIGIEYCEELNHIARRNLARCPQQPRQCDCIEIIRADAAEYPIPDQPLLLYFFNPFGQPVMRRVVDNVVASLQRSPRRVVVLYFTPYFDHLWEETRSFKRTQASPAIFDAGPVSRVSEANLMVRTE